MPVPAGPVPIPAESLNSGHVGPMSVSAKPVNAGPMPVPAESLNSGPNASSSPANGQSVNTSQFVSLSGGLSHPSDFPLFSPGSSSEFPPPVVPPGLPLESPKPLMSGKGLNCGP